ncbi:ComF family protein [Patescibacteria group bacterium]|nr:ComF family protein [Patescibacteria group bacterium]
MPLKFKNILTKIENYLFPEYCLICKQAGNTFCPACRASIKQSTPRCSFCGQKSTLGLICNNCRQNNIDYPIDGVFAYSSYEYTYLKIALKALKFQGLRPLGLILGRMLGRKLLTEWRIYQSTNPTQKLISPTIIAMPLHKKRERERGFNQSLLIAQGVSEICNWQINTNLQRRSYQKPSAQLKYHSRLKQKKIFLYSSDKNLQKQTIILVDDIFTTGATAHDAALALKQAGAGTIIVVVVAQSI